MGVIKWKSEKIEIKKDKKNFFTILEIIYLFDIFLHLLPLKCRPILHVPWYKGYAPSMFGTSHFGNQNVKKMCKKIV